MSEQMSFEGFDNGTCSPASGAGRSPCASQDGQTIAKSSPRRVRASRSARPAAAPDSMTNGIYGPVRTPSSVTCAPKSVWESRLMDLLGTCGSTERELTWKILATPSEQSYFQLAVSTPRRVDIAGFGLPQEPNADAKLWSGVKAKSSTGAGQRGDGGPNIQTEVAAVTEHWPIVSARDWKSDSSIKTGEELYGTKGKPLARTALEVAQGEHWPGVRANRRGNPDSHGADPVALVTAELLPALRASDAVAGSPKVWRNGSPKNGLRLVDIGTLPDGSSDPTATSELAPSRPGVSPPRPGGSLYPAMAAWLQGYSRAHLNCAPSCLPKAGRTARRKSKATEMPSCPK